MHSIAHKPELMPYLEAMPQVMRMLQASTIYAGQDADFLHTQLGGNPHASVRAEWLRWVIGRPASEFRGKAVWYRNRTGHPVKFRDALSIEGLPFGRDIADGEVFTLRSWRLMGQAGYETIDRTPWAPKLAEEQHKPWSEIQAMGFRAAKAYLATLDVHGRSWADLELEYSGYCLGDS